jgi:ADP-heptose:LPS heptosyltransferase
LSGSISPSELLSASPEEVRAFGEERPAEFFRIVEALADSFDPAQTLAYERLMAAWGLSPAASAKRGPETTDIVYVLSRVTLGADIKITSVVLDAMKRRYPGARVIFVSNRKSAELFERDEAIGHCEVEYPRKGPVSERLAFARELRERLAGEQRIVIDPDSRMTQLGLVAVCEPECYFHFPSRSTGNERDNLTTLTNAWLRKIFGVEGVAYLAPHPVRVEGERPVAAVSLGVGGNESKRIGGDFEARLLRLIGERYQTVCVDRGAGGEEARRVTAAVEASRASDRVQFWEGSFAGFASVIAQSDVYVGYDSAGQHAAAAAGVRSFTIFRGAVSKAFRNRWAPMGRGESTVLGDRAEDTPEDCIHMLQLALDRKRLG